MKNSPSHWRELTDEQKDKVEHYIRTLLAQQIPLVKKPGHEVIDQKLEAGISYQLEKILCGKNCKGCPHGPYWYAYFRKSGKVVSRYIGKEFKPPSKSYVTDHW